MCSDFAKNILKLFSGGALSQIIWMMSMLVLARLYEPYYFGSYQSFIAIIGIAIVFMSLRYEMAIVLPKRKSKALQVFALSVIINIFFVAVLMVLIYCVYDYLRLFIGDKYDLVLKLGPIYLIILGNYQILYNWFVREKYYNYLSIIINVFPLFFLCVAYCLAGTELKNYGLISAVIIARMIEVVIMWVIFIKKNKAYYFKVISVKRMKHVFHQYINFPKYMLLSSWFDNMAEAVPVIMLGIFWGDDIVGYYAIAIQALAAPSALIAKSLGDVFRQRASWYYQQFFECEGFYLKNLKILTSISIIVVVTVLLLAPEAYSIAFGSQWQESGNYARWIILGVGAWLVASPLSMIYIIAEKQRVYFLLQALNLSVRCCLLVLGWYLFDSVMCTLLIYSVGSGCVAVYILILGRRIAGGKCIIP